MLFNTQQYLYLFLPAVIIIFAVLSRFNDQKLLITFLLISSVVFYGISGWQNLAIIILSAIFNFYSGRYLNYSKSRSFLAFCISLNILLLGYFKYSNFFLDNLNALTGSEYSIQNLILPLGISFFTFSQTAFLIESYRGNTLEKNFMNYLLYVSFFPYVSSGPISYHREIAPQFADPFNLKFSWNNLSIGFVLFSFGLFKKTVLADNLAFYASPLFDNLIQDEDNISKVMSYDLVNTWKAALAYTFQLYFDFSGYSDMAIGTAQVFGIKLPLNFNSPYKAKNIVEFWKRWHMTLSRFFRDYVFLPFSFIMSRKLPLNSLFGSDIFIYASGIFITWMLTGLWHGAGWNFVLWGIMHAAYLIVNRIIKKPKKKFLKSAGISEKNPITVFLYITLTFISVTTAWVYFRANDLTSANKIIAGMTGFNGLMSATTDLDGYLLILFAAIIVFFMPNTQEIMYDFKIGLDTYSQPVVKPHSIFLLKMNIKFSFVIAVILAISIIFVQSVQKMEFIYNDF